MHGGGADFEWQVTDTANTTFIHDRGPLVSTGSWSKKDKREYAAGVRKV
jgi:hypothetical protein